MSPEPNSAAARFKLLVQAGPRVGEVIPIDRTVLRVGRQLTNDLVISDAKVSRQHARLEQQDDGLLITDEGSSNGTYVNGIRIDGPTLLQPGDVIAFGASHLLVQTVQAPAEPSPAAPAPPAAAAPAAPPAPLDDRAEALANRQTAPATPSPVAPAPTHEPPPVAPAAAASSSAQTVFGPAPMLEPPTAEPAPVAPTVAPSAPPPIDTPAPPTPEPVGVSPTAAVEQAPPRDEAAASDASASSASRPGFLQRLLAVFKRRS